MASSLLSGLSGYVDIGLVLLWIECNGCMLVAGKSGAGEQTWYKRSRLISAYKTPKNQNIQKNNKSGYKTHFTPTHDLHKTCDQTISDKDMRGNRGFKYTTCN